MKTFYDWLLLVSILAIIYRALRLDWIGRLVDKLIKLKEKMQVEEAHREALFINYKLDRIETYKDRLTEEQYKKFRKYDIENKHIM